MDTFERNAARALAIAYHAYCNAGPHNWQPWAKMLLQAQRDTGVELVPASTLLYSPPGAELAAVIAAARAPAPPDPTRGVHVANVTFSRSEGDEDGGAMVPAPKPPPRKPSPGASVASAAAQFYARAGR